MEKIPVIINNFNLLTWPKAMVEKIETFEGVGDIIILDNQSTYEPLLDWYSACKYRVVKLNKNYGHHALWKSNYITNIISKYYIYTDPDLFLDNLTEDTVIYLKDNFEDLINRKLFKVPHKIKLGLGLDYTTVPEESKFYTWCNTYEKHMHETDLLKEGIYKSPVDTTFAIYQTANKYYDVGGARTTFPYCCRHLPWEIITPDEEFTYYLERVNASCSYKKFLEKT